MVFVVSPHPQSRNEYLPHTAVAKAHGIPARLPTVELTHHRNHDGVGGPDRKADARHAVNFGDVRAQ